MITSMVTLSAASEHILPQAIDTSFLRPTFCPFAPCVSGDASSWRLPTPHLPTFRHNDIRYDYYLRPSLRSSPLSVRIVSFSSSIRVLCFSVSHTVFVSRRFIPYIQCDCWSMFFFPVMLQISHIVDKIGSSPSNARAGSRSSVSHIIPRPAH